MKRYILFFCILFSVSLLDGQIIETKNAIGISAGKFISGGPDDLFFPKGIKNNSTVIRADYFHTILPWMKIGIEGSLMMPSKTGGDDIIQISSHKEQLLTSGVNATFFSPFKESGWRNRLRLQFGIAPVAVIHQGERIASIDNEVWNKEDQVSEEATVTMKGPSTGFGLSLTPALEYSIEQGIGLRVSCNTLTTSMKSDLTKQNLSFYSLNLGLFFRLSKSKNLNY